MATVAEENSTHQNESGRLPSGVLESSLDQILVSFWPSISSDRSIVKSKK